MALKAKKEILAPPKAKAKAKTKTAVLKGIHDHKKKKDSNVTHLATAWNTSAQRAVQTDILGRAPLGKTSLTIVPLSSSPSSPS